MSIQSEINRLNAAKAELKTSIENGGVTVSLNAKIDAYPALVDAITEQIKDKVDVINGEVVEGDVDAKLNKITSTKTDLAAALAEKGQTVGDVFADYPAAVRAIETGGGFMGTAKVTFNAPLSGYATREISYIDENYELVSNVSKDFVQIPFPQIVFVDFQGTRESTHSYSGNATKVYPSLGVGPYYIYGDAVFTASK